MKKYVFTGKDKFEIEKFDTNDTGGMSKGEAEEKMIKNLPKIDELQKKLYAQQKESVIFLFQAMDAAGKDGTIQAVLSCLSPHGVKEYAFKAPSSIELSHDYLWRIHKCVPPKGQIAIFNRSHYEDVLVARVHEIYKNQSHADYINQNDILKYRYRDIKNFEQYLYHNSVRIVKIFLNVSKEEQAKRFIARLNTPDKVWKFSTADIKEREFFQEYQKAFEDAVNETASPTCPWYVVPANHKWYMRYLVSEIILSTLQQMKPQYPQISKELMKSYEKFLKELKSEKV